MALHRRRPPSRALLSNLGGVLCAAIALTACGEAPPPKAADTAHADVAEQKKIDEGKKKIDGANRAYNSQKYDEARKLLLEAKALDAESQRFDIGELLEKVDKRFAKLWATEVGDALKDKQCEAPFKQLADKVEELQSETFTRELRNFVDKQATACVEGYVDAKIAAGDLAAARALVDAPATATVLGPVAMKKATAGLDESIVSSLRAKMDADLKARAWEKAAATIDEAQKKGDASDAHVRELVKALRDAMTPSLEALADDGLGSQKAPAALKKLDTLIALARWEVMPGDVAELAQYKALPEKLAKKRQTLATWVEAQRLRFKNVKRAEKRWVHGKVAITPPEKSDGVSKRDLEPAIEVWVIGTTRDKALVTTVEPESSTLAAMFDKAVGWAPLARLAVEPTDEWIPPDDQLKGVRVWAPLRAPETAYELGIVDEVVGADVNVKRLADDQIVKVARKSLRSGRLSVGTKVMAFCGDKAQVATVAELMTDGRSVKVKCENGDLKEESLPSLRSKVELLPSTK